MVLSKTRNHLKQNLNLCNFTYLCTVLPNFRLLHRLFVQIERILRINELSVITEDIVEAARSTLVIGAT